MSLYSWPVYPCSGEDNFELKARNSLEMWRTNGVAIEARLNDIEDGTYWLTSGQVIHGSAIIDQTLSYSAFEDLLSWDQIKAEGSPLEAFSLIYRDAAFDYDGGFVWEPIVGIAGEESYTVKWDAGSGTSYLAGWVALQSEAEAGSVNNKLMTPERVNQAIQALAPELPAGMIAPFAMAEAPDGWIYCDGDTLDSDANPEYASLFAAIGIIHGGSGSSDFDLPDYRDEFLRGTSSTRDVGDTETDAIRSHDHSATANVTGGNHTHDIRAGYAVGTGGTLASGSDYTELGSTLGEDGHSHVASVNVGSNNGAGSETRPRSKFVYYCIKL